MIFFILFVFVIMKKSLKEFLYEIFNFKFFQSLIINIFMELKLDFLDLVFNFLKICFCDIFFLKKFLIFQMKIGVKNLSFYYHFLFFHVIDFVKVLRAIGLTLRGVSCEPNENSFQDVFKIFLFFFFK